MAGSKRKRKAPQIGPRAERSSTITLALIDRQNGRDYRFLRVVTVLTNPTDLRISPNLTSAWRRGRGGDLSHQICPIRPIGPMETRPVNAGQREAVQNRRSFFVLGCLGFWLAQPDRALVGILDQRLQRRVAAACCHLLLNDTQCAARCRCLLPLPDDARQR